MRKKKTSHGDSTTRGTRAEVKAEEARKEKRSMKDTEKKAVGAADESNGEGADGRSELKKLYCELGKAMTRKYEGWDEFKWCLGVMLGAIVWLVIDWVIREKAGAGLEGAGWFTAARIVSCVLCVAGLFGVIIGWRKAVQSEREIQATTRQIRELEAEKGMIYTYKK